MPHRVTGCYGSALKNFGSGIPSTSRDYTVTQVLEGDRSFGLVVRWKPGYREDLVAMRNIRVNVVAPGATRTPIWSRGRNASLSAEETGARAKFIESLIPLGRWGEAEEIAKAALFLASDDSSYVNAIELLVDGGMTGAPLGAPRNRG